MTKAALRATVAHAAPMAAIHAASFPPREAWGEDAIALQLAMPGAFGLIDARGGMLLARVTADEAEVLTLAVAPDVRRQGVARALLAQAMAIARAQTARTMVLEVAIGNVAARALYEHAGFTEVGRRARYYADGGDALILRAPLASPSPALGQRHIGPGKSEI
jgi:[ribosomal protein S18]-alanine N-acetyltransferase